MAPMDGLIIPVAGGAIVVPATVLFVGAIALAMRWAERLVR